MLNSQKREGSGSNRHAQRRNADGTRIAAVGATYPLSVKRSSTVLQVEVRFYGFVRDVIGTSNFSLETAQSTTLREFLDLLIQRFGERLRERLLTRTGELEANVQVFVGDTRAISLEEPLGNGQRPFAQVKVFVLSATAGG